MTATKDTLARLQSVRRDLSDAYYAEPDDKTAQAIWHARDAVNDAIATVIGMDPNRYTPRNDGQAVADALSLPRWS